MYNILKYSLVLAMFMLAPKFVISHPNNTFVNDSNLVEELLLRNYAEEQLHLSATQYNKLTQADKANLQASGLGIFFRKSWNAIFGESKKWGQYRESGHNDEGPYMTFQYNENAPIKLSF